MFSRMVAILRREQSSKFDALDLNLPNVLIGFAMASMPLWPIYDALVFFKFETKAERTWVMFCRAYVGTWILLLVSAKLFTG